MSNVVISKDMWDESDRNIRELEEIFHLKEFRIEEGLKSLYILDGTRIPNVELPPKLIPCPICGNMLVPSRMFNVDIFGEENNPWFLHCKNDKCHGWYCDACDKWHPYGISCSVHDIRQLRDGDCE